MFVSFCNKFCKILAIVVSVCPSVEHFVILKKDFKGELYWIGHSHLVLLSVIFCFQVLDMNNA